MIKTAIKHYIIEKCIDTALKNIDTLGSDYMDVHYAITRNPYGTTILVMVINETIIKYSFQSLSIISINDDFNLEYLTSHNVYYKPPTNAPYHTIRVPLNIIKQYETVVKYITKEHYIRYGQSLNKIPNDYVVSYDLNASHNTPPPARSTPDTKNYKATGVWVIA